MLRRPSSLPIYPIRQFPTTMTTTVLAHARSFPSAAQGLYLHSPLGPFPWAVLVLLCPQLCVPYSSLQQYHRRMAVHPLLMYCQTPHLELEALDFAATILVVGSRLSMIRSFRRSSSCFLALPFDVLRRGRSKLLRRRGGGMPWLSPVEGWCMRS